MFNFFREFGLKKTQFLPQKILIEFFPSNEVSKHHRRCDDEENRYFTYLVTYIREKYEEIKEKFTRETDLMRITEMLRKLYRPWERKSSFSSAHRFISKSFLCFGQIYVGKDK